MASVLFYGGLGEYTHTHTSLCNSVIIKEKDSELTVSLFIKNMRKYRYYEETLKSPLTYSYHSYLAPRLPIFFVVTKRLV